MNAPQHDYGQALSVDAEAVGRPGNRRFRLIVVASVRAASIWMEKQQLASIGDWFEEIGAKLDQEKPSSEPDVEPSPTPVNFEVDFRAVQIGLGYQEDEDVYTIHAFDGQSADDTTPTFRAQVSRGQARVLARKIASVVAAGRQICPLCELPMDPEGHVCPRSNGHHAGATV
jgi:uncharacterized repeat protein (TIGR03847 family)